MEHLSILRDAGIEKEVSAFTIGIPDAESIRCPRIPIGTNAGKLGRCLKRGLKLAYLPSPGLVRLRITAEWESVKHLDDVNES